VNGVCLAGSPDYTQSKRDVLQVENPLPLLKKISHKTQEFLANIHNDW
jgi:hypothetical protein